MELLLEDDGEDISRTVYIDKEDICMWCEQQYGCPLIECLANGLVEPVDDIRVVDCAHYIKFDGQ